MTTITTKETRKFNWANPGVLKVGDEITETLKDGREVVFVVMDEGVIGLKNLLGRYYMNRDCTNKGGWLACDMRRWLNSEVLALLPDELLAVIKPRKFGKEPDREKQLEYFKDRRNRVKFDATTTIQCRRLRSSCAGYNILFCRVNSRGRDISYSTATSSGGVCFGFYIFGGDGN